jgi:hypothetical protein
MCPSYASSQYGQSVVFVIGADIHGHRGDVDWWCEESPVKCAAWQWEAQLLLRLNARESCVEQTDARKRLGRANERCADSSDNRVASVVDLT